MIKIYFRQRAEPKTRQWKFTLTLRICQRHVYTGSFELDHPRILLAVLHILRIEIPYRAFPERVGPSILSLESVDYFGTTDHFKVYWKIRIEDGGIRDRGSVKKNLKIVV